MFSASDAKALVAKLPELSFDLDKDEQFIKNSSAQKYLNHYKINFSQSIAGVHHGFGKITMDNYTIACHYWLPEMSRGTVFVVHGYFDHVGLFSHIIRFALQNEFAVVAFDLPGMGLSSGDRAAIGDFREYYSVLSQCLQRFENLMPKPWHCVAQSTGSTAVFIMMLEKHSNAFDRVIVLAPLLRSCGWSRQRWIYMLGRFFLRSVQRKFAENSHDAEFLKFLKKSDPLQYRRQPLKWVGAMKAWIERFPKFEPQPYNMLIIQGDQDSTVDWRYNIEKIKEKLPKAKVKLIPQARHHLVAESAPYRAQVFAAIKSYWDKSNYKLSQE